MEKMLDLLVKIQVALIEGRINEAILLEEQLHKVISTYKDAC